MKIKLYRKIFFFLSVMMLIIIMGDMNRQVNAATIKVRKVTGIKKSKAIDGMKFISKKNHYDGYYRKITWKKIKNVKGYEVFSYDYLMGNWEKVLTVKKNSFKVTRMLSDVKVKFKVRAYKTKGSKKVYGKFSKTITYTEKEMLDYNHNGKLVTKGCYAEGKDDYYKESAKRAFIKQNEYRKKAGKKKLIWNDQLYEIAKIRAKEQVKSFGHKRADGEWFWITFSEYLGKEKYISLGGGEAFSENAAMGQDSPLKVMLSWYNSKGHKKNFMREDWNYGAIACYNGMYWIAVFSRNNVD